jgi:uncharacterized protein (DUF2062 family)
MSAEVAMATPPDSDEVAVEAPKRSVFYRWVVRPVVQQLTQGTSAAKIAQAIAWGVAIGIFPIIGATTLLSLLVGVPMKLNQPVLQTFKTAATPLQWALVLGFYRAGEWLFEAPHVSIHIPSMIERFFAEPGPFFRDYGMTAVYGIAVWCLVAPLLIVGIRVVSQYLVEKLAKRVRRDGALQ